MQVQKYDLWLYVPRIMPLNFLLWVFVVALRKRYGCVVTALLLHCCCFAVARCRRRVVGIFLYGALDLHKDFVAVQINCTFAADFTN